MHNNLFLGLFIAAIVLLMVAAVYSISKGAAIPTWLTVTISMLALVVSLLSTFKSELLPSDIVLIGGDVLLAQTIPPSQQPVIPFVFSLGFLNQGYGEDIVEWIAIKATNEADNTVRLLTPIAEIDFQKFIQGKRLLHAENMIGQFAPFPLASKASITKSILFDQEPNHAKYPKMNWAPGRYRFDLYLKTASSPSSSIKLSVRHGIDDNLLRQFFLGLGSHHIAQRQFDL